jgi:hypothetical protein
LIIIAEKKKGTTNEQFHPTHPNLKKRERTYPSRSKYQIPDFLKNNGMTGDEADKVMACQHWMVMDLW